MAKFKMMLELQGLKLQVEGEKEDVPAIRAAVEQQFAGLLKPAEAIALQETGAVDRHAEDRSTTGEGAVVRKSKRRTTGERVAKNGAEPKAIDFRHDADKFGTPQQGWSVGTKAKWLLWVVGEQAAVKEASAMTIVRTFNKHFREAGLIDSRSIYRDLRRLKSASQVEEDATKKPSVFFLSQAGRNAAEQLIQRAASAS